MGRAPRPARPTQEAGTMAQDNTSPKRRNTPPVTPSSTPSCTPKPRKRRLSRKTQAWRALQIKTRLEAAINPMFRLQAALNLVPDNVLSRQDRVSLNHELIAIECRLISLEVQAAKRGEALA